MLTHPKMFRRFFEQDPRWYQISVLLCLTLFGVGVARFDVGPGRIALILSLTVLFQLLFTKIYRLPVFDPKSALISGLSLCLLLRTNSWWLAAAACALAIGSKFMIRWKGRHLFNPTNFAIVAMLIAAPSTVWVSHGQWGSALVFAGFVACLGIGVAGRAARLDVAIAFLASHAGFLFARALWLGDPLVIPFHQLQSGALVIFTFFMISDPKTTPDTRLGRILFAICVAAGGYWIRFSLFNPNALLYSLAVCTLLVPLLNRLLPGEKYSWEGRRRDESLVYAVANPA